MKINKILSIIIGLVFYVSGMGKLFNIVGFQYLIIQYGLDVFHILAPFIVILEIMIGVLLFLQIRVKPVSILAFIMLLIFTLVFAYANIKNGVTDCGCFGSISFLNNSPLLTYIRNVVLLIMLIWIICNSDDSKKVELWKNGIVLIVLLVVCFISGMSYKPFAFSKPKQHAFENKSIKDNDLYQFVNSDDKTKLVFFFSYDCPHCLNSIENYKSFYEKNTVDTTYAYAIVDDSNVNDSMINVIKSYYSDVAIKEIHKDLTGFVKAYPTTFYIENDTVKKVIRGQLPTSFMFQK